MSDLTEHHSGEIPVLEPPPDLDAAIQRRKGYVVTWPVIGVVFASFVTALIAMGAIFLAYRSQRSLATDRGVQLVLLRDEQRCRAEASNDVNRANADLQTTVADIVAAAISRTPDQVAALAAELNVKKENLRAAVAAQTTALTECAKNP